MTHKKAAHPAMEVMVNSCGIWRNGSIHTVYFLKINPIYIVKICQLMSRGKDPIFPFTNPRGFFGGIHGFENMFLAKSPSILDYTISKEYNTSSINREGNQKRNMLQSVS